MWLHLSVCMCVCMYVCVYLCVEHVQLTTSLNTLNGEQIASLFENKLYA